MISDSNTIEGLLSSNYPPGPLKTGTIQEEVRRLKKQVSALRARLKVCEEQLRRHQSVLSAIRRVPLEVFGSIFGFVLPTECLDEEGRAQLVKLSLVCRHWCEAARSVPRFWSHLQVRDIDLDYDRAVAWFSRSSTTCRTLRIQREPFTWCGLHYGGAKNPECRLASPALIRLLTEGSGLEQLTIEVNGSRCLQHLLDVFAPHGDGVRPWDKVKSLTLDIFMSTSDPSTPSKTLHGIPSCITALSLDFSYIYRHRLPIQPSAFECLSSLSVTSMWSVQNGGFLLAALTHCANLEVLTLNFFSRPWTCSVGSDVVELPKLKTLHLSLPARDFEFLNFIHAPALIQLGAFITNGIQYPGALEGFIQKLSVLRDDFGVSLHFAESCPPESVINLLRHVPKVTHLTLESIIKEPKYRYSEGDFFDELRCLQGNGTLLADLQFLEILQLPPEFDFSSIKEYIESRRAFKHLIVKYNRAFLPEGCTIDLAEWVKEVSETGVLVDVTYPEIYRENLLGIYNL